MRSIEGRKADTDLSPRVRRRRADYSHDRTGTGTRRVRDLVRAGISILNSSRARARPARKGRATVVRRDSEQPQPDGWAEGAQHERALTMKVCPRCNGRGWIGDDECPDCNGSGRVEDDEQEPAPIREPDPDE
jgi:DnaJ-class molecular chaperone